ncbi:hypothetical protein ACLKA7_011098 [Drosophila subpalustris]
MYLIFHIYVSHCFLLLVSNNFCYVVSQKGRTLLLHDGFYYIREKASSHKTYWRCTQYTTALKCHGRIHTLNGRIVHYYLMLVAHFSSTRKKKRKLLIDKHEFVMDRKLKSSINWRCARYRSANCKIRGV